METEIIILALFSVILIYSMSHMSHCFALNKKVNENNLWLWLWCFLFSTWDYAVMNMPGTTQGPAGSIILHHVVQGIYTGPHSEGKKKPQTQSSMAAGELMAGEDEKLKGLLGFPEEMEIGMHDIKLCLPLLVLSRV